MAIAELANLEKKLWTQDECEAMMQAGIDLRRYELIEGELTKKVAKSHAHMLALILLMNLLNRMYGEGHVLPAGSIRLANRISEPEPDLVVLNRHFGMMERRPHRTTSSLLSKSRTPLWLITLK